MFVRNEDGIGPRELRGIIRNAVTQFAHRVHLDGQALVADFQAGVLDKGYLHRLPRRGEEALDLIGRDRVPGPGPGEVPALEVADLEARLVECTGRGCAALSAAAVHRDGKVRRQLRRRPFHEVVGVPVQIDGPSEMPSGILVGCTDVHQLDGSASGNLLLEFPDREVSVSFAGKEA